MGCGAPVANKPETWKAASATAATGDFSVGLRGGQYLPNSPNLNAIPALGFSGSLMSAMSLSEAAHAQTQQPAMQNGTTELIETHRPHRIEHNAIEQ